jgi:hypothetical protein
VGVRIHFTTKIIDIHSVCFLVLESIMKSNKSAYLADLIKRSRVDTEN